MSSPDAVYFAAPGQLQDVFLTSIEFQRHETFDLDVHDAPPYAIETTTDATLSAEHDLVMVSFRAEIEWADRRDHDDDRRYEKPFDLALTLGGSFQWAVPDAAADDIVGWIKFNTDHLFWPYLRAYTQQITAFSDLPPLTLYTIRVPRPRLGATESSDERSTP